MMIMQFFLFITLLSLLIWVGLLLFRGQFWRTDQCLNVTGDQFSNLPAIAVIIPARNEADVLPMSLASLLTQDYPNLQVILVDDQSDDGTGDVAKNLAASLGKSDRLNVISGQPLPSGWSGKLWAVNQAVEFAEGLASKPDYLLLTDADIYHHNTNLQELAIKAITEDLDLVSLMVLLRCESLWEKFLIPAFVFFFQKLYPFKLVNNPDNKTAAAAGGCILIKRETLQKIGGISVLRQALIDDCTLASYVKKSGGKIWLGLTQKTKSLRAYNSLNTIWDMVARTAFTQLNYSPFLLLGTVFGMTLVYLIAPIATISGLFLLQWQIAIAGLAVWLLMTLAYFPMIKYYQISPFWSLSLPAIALLYNLMTLDSALRYWQGKGGKWKGRVYQDLAN
jgi:hopene-associated glycosyltransferase HpnB